ncbi:MAG: xanthine dehydrogenase family protein subunit M [Solirubrobacterales bacterium]|nr:xanthine dehydrogenase family protein subunit M [Solirubrobacterales bacterium]
MKPPRFAYHDPRSLDEALALLAEHGDDGKALAGGQSLVPLLNFRLAQPEHLIDLNRIGALAGITRRAGRLHIGTMTRQSTLEHSALVRDGWPLLTEALTYVAHAQIRNRGTVGGSVAHADPAAELPVAFNALDARFRVASRRGERTVAAADFFVTHLTTALEADEALVEIEVPPTPAGTGHAFTEYARRHGDFALGGAAALVTVDESGTCTRAALALLAAGPTPARAPEAERALVGAGVDAQAATEAAARATAEIHPTGDIHGSGEYRRDLVEVMVRRAIELANERAVSTREAGRSANGASGG